MKPIIRRATVEDAEPLAALARKTFYDTFTGTCTEADMQQFLDACFTPETARQELSDPEDYFFIAEVEGSPAGYMRIKEDYSSFDIMQQWKALELKRIYIDQPFHGKGIAQLLMQFLESFARERKYEVIWLGVWEHNYRAMRFYEKSGFEDSGHTHDFPIGSTPQTDKWFWKFLHYDH